MKLELARPQQMAVGTVYIREIPGVHETPVVRVQRAARHPQTALLIERDGSSGPISRAIQSPNLIIFGGADGRLVSPIISLDCRLHDPLRHPIWVR
jgi:hypothetical protein